MGNKGIDTLALWSAVALVLRVLAIGLLVFIARIQFNEFKYRTTLQPLKRLLFWSVVVIIISNVPILWLHWYRIFGLKGSNDHTSFATVTNAAGMLAIAILLYLVYHFKGDSGEE